MLAATTNSSVYFPGETLYCKIALLGGTVHQYDASTSPHPVFLSSITPATSSDRDYTVLWASAQIHGNYVVDPTWLKLPPLSSNQAKSKSPTSPLNTSLNNLNSSNSGNTNSSINNTSLPNFSDLGPNGRSVFASPATILACELKIDESSKPKTFFYYCTLPSTLPPSFKGSGIKYSYYITIAVHVSGSNGAQLFNLPIRVLTPSAAIKKITYPLGNPGFIYDSGYIESNESDPLEAELSARPELWAFLVSRLRMHMHSPSYPSPLVPYPQTPSQYDSYHTRHALNTLLEKHSKQVTRHISKGSDRLLTFSIGKSAFQLGETVAGSLVFYRGNVPCHQASVRLECEETVEPALLVTRNGAKSTRRVYGELVEYTLHSLQTHFAFYIPIDASPEFSTDQISVQWFLHFEFVTSVDPASNNSNGNGPPLVDILHWSMPIRVLVHSYPHESLYHTKNIMRSGNI